MDEMGAPDLEFLTVGQSDIDAKFMGLAGFQLAAAIAE